MFEKNENLTFELVTRSYFFYFLTWNQQLGSKNMKV